MQADFSVELGGDAPALEIPWRSDDPQARYYDLKKHPDLVQKIPEAVSYPELGSLLSRINATGFPLATAKCDAWTSSEVAPEEEIFGDRKFVSYIDLIFVDERDRCSFEKHEAFAKELCRLLGYAPEIAATVELVIRHCYYHQEGFVSENEAEQSTPLSKTVKDSGMSSPGDEDALDHTRQGDVAPQEGSTRTTNYGRRARVIRGESAKVSAHGENVSARHCEELSEVTDRDEQVRTTNHGDLAILSEGRLGAKKSERADLLHGNDLFKAEPSEKSRTGLSGKSCNVQLPRKSHCGEPNASIAGFCLTVYVAGFGDNEHDPMRRWMVGLNLLQHAIVQLNSNSQPKD